ncbi:hypothetical protein MO988_07835 [Vibrio vulnificus]|uniref:tyrosine-type recombinase/integrase n=1 Tax=Vibrio vulnificus TaxID=672 RepID=UPI001FAE45AF|nr:hypothetical protein [Vibrio vulnificus]MCJ0821314.1 hypothetical protein [Vibrio vulnificus]
MYLLRLPNSVYYTRVATPLSLRSMGYPKESRFSLFTRERRVAYLRNVEHTKLIFALFTDADSQQLPYNTFKAQLNEQVNQLRQQFQQESRVDIALCKSLPINKETKPNNTALQVDEQALERFIASKALEKVTNLTLKQLRQRCGDFLAYCKKHEAAKISSSVAMAYRDELLCRGLSHKTLKDYLAANKQFLNWCVVHELLQSNPFTQVKLPSKSGSDSSQRTRWGISELKRLFNSQAFKQQGESFRWATMVMFRHGCRPSESCQLRVMDVHFDKSILLSELVNMCMFAFGSNGMYPIVHNSFEKLLEHQNKDRADGNYKNKVTEASILYPLLAVFCSLYELNSVSQELEKFATDKLAHCTLQYWYPNEYSERFMYSNSGMHGSASTKFPMNSDLALEHIAQECDSSDSFKKMSAAVEGKLPLLLTAYRCYRYPVPFHFVEGFVEDIFKQT